VSSPVPIAFCITELDRGGAESALLQIVTRLDPGHWAPAVYALGPRGELADELQHAGIPTHCLGARSARDIAVVPRLVRILRRQRPMLLQTFLFHANIAGRFAGRCAGVPVIVSGIRVAERDRRQHLLIERLSRRLVTHHVCVSQSVADFSIASARLDPAQVSVIPNGVDFDRFSSASPADLAQFGIPPAADTLLFVGRLHRQKGLSVLLEAMPPLLSAFPNLHLLLVGSGPLEEEVRQHVARAGLQSRIHLIGRRNDVPSLMRASAALVLPSLWEGLPNAVLEAMAAGLPVVVTDVDGAGELVQEGRTGWVAKSGSAESLKSAIERRLNCSPATLTDVVRRSQSLVKSSFTWEACSQAHATLYTRLLAHGGFLNTHTREFGAAE
jgi:glycosyltransferase involved in cell wall biosynthesis